MGKIGLNTDTRGYTCVPEEVASWGTQAVRFTADLSWDAAPLVSRYTTRGITAVLCLDANFLSDDERLWRDRLDLIKYRHRGQGVIFQPGNEPDAGFDPGAPLGAADRAASGKYPSSWCMDTDRVNRLLRAARSVLGWDEMIATPGFSSGYPQFCTGAAGERVETELAHYVAYHGYGKHPTIRQLPSGGVWGTGYLPDLVAGYKVLDRYNAGLICSEIGWQTSPPAPDGMGLEEHGEYMGGVFRYYRDSADHLAMTAFCADDRMVPGFGLRTEAGEWKPGGLAYLAVTGAFPLTPPVVPPLRFEAGFARLAAQDPELFGEPRLYNEFGPWDEGGASQILTTTGTMVAMTLQTWPDGLWGHTFVHNDGRVFRWREDWPRYQEVHPPRAG